MSKLHDELWEKHYIIWVDGDHVTDRCSFTAALDEAMEAQRKACADGIERMSIGEVIHTAFRKASGSDEANRIWHEIKAMPLEEWGKIIAFVLACIKPAILNAKVEDNA